MVNMEPSSNTSARFTLLLPSVLGVMCRRRTRRGRGGMPGRAAQSAALVASKGTYCTSGGYSQGFRTLKELTRKSATLWVTSTNLC